MSHYYVATLSRYVLVDAENEPEARQLGYERLKTEFGKDVPVAIKVVRPATEEEIELKRWHEELVRNEA